jgi:hypothetical protein
MKRLSRIKVSGLLSIAAMIVGSSICPAFAGFNHGNEVTFSGDPLFAITGSAGGFSPERRAWQAQDAMDNALANAASLSPDSVAVVRKNGALTLQLDGHYVTTADAASANACGMSPSALADKWAGALKAKLSDSEGTAAYVATLRNPNALKGDIAMVDRNVTTVDSGPSIAFRVAEGAVVVDSQDPETVYLTLDRAVVVEDGEMPAGAILTGSATRDDKGIKYISFNSCKCSDGRVISLNNVVAESMFLTEAPHPVCSAAIPADPQTESRVPALIGVGATEARVAVIEARPATIAVVEPPTAL